MRKVMLSVIFLYVALVATSCSTVPEYPEEKAVLSSEVEDAIALFKAQDPGIESFFSSSYGYAVMPKIVKGAFIVGGASGSGEVFEQGKMVGYCRMDQATLGFSIGGESFQEIIFFEDMTDLYVFMTEGYTFSAQVTTVAMSAGTAAKTDYNAGMAVFIMTDTGLMVDASVGGQKFHYVPIDAQ